MTSQLYFHLKKMTNYNAYYVLSNVWSESVPSSASERAAKWTVTVVPTHQFTTYIPLSVMC